MENIVYILILNNYNNILYIYILNRKMLPGHNYIQKYVRNGNLVYNISRWNPQFNKEKFSNIYHIRSEKIYRPWIYK